MKQLIEIIKQEKIIAILRGIPSEKTSPVLAALYRGGIRLLEVTFDQRSENRHRETGEAIRLARTLFPDMHVGAGTVMSREDVFSAHEAGAEFILAPNVNKKVIKTAVKLGMTAIPGAMTPTEIAAASRYGADIVKLFPAGEAGLGYAKAVMAPLNHIPLLAVGGINRANLGEYLDSGFLGAGIGSSLTDKKLIAESDWDGLEALAQEYVRIAREHS